MRLQFTPFPEIKTERLLLRQIRKEDAVGIWSIRSDERVNKFLDRDSNISMDDALLFIDKISKVVSENKGGYWVIEAPVSQLAGTICFWNISVEKETAEIGYELHPDFQGKGIMQEAIEKIISYGFNTMELKTITAFPKEGNERSIKLLEKFNFEIDTRSPGNNEELKGYIIYSLNPAAFSMDYRTK